MIQHLAVEQLAALVRVVKQVPLVELVMIKQVQLVAQVRAKQVPPVKLVRLVSLVPPLQR